MGDDRNLTSHTDQEEPAAEIVTRLRDHPRVLRKWVQALSAGVTEASAARWLVQETHRRSDAWFWHAGSAVRSARGMAVAEVGRSSTAGRERP